MLEVRHIKDSSISMNYLTESSWDTVEQRSREREEANKKDQKIKHAWES